eukprot:TRINITY_DN3757_c0_g1_i2.p1 TRINITY_DN3757_c0_g1~~TRINITY_DN3757_c0_g1_i2.p1  ORF type:complete len:117 (-),score=27.80 TRINITY_DN3757_c0_g1_i2:14-364(-)
MILFDTTNTESFQNIKYWIEEVERYSNNEPVIIFVGTKCDLVDQRRIVREEIEDFAKQIGIHYMETSSKFPMNVDECFLYLANEVYEMELSKKKNTNSVVLNPNFDKKKKNECILF